MSTTSLEAALKAAMNEVMESMFYLSCSGSVDLPAEVPDDWMMRELNFLGPQNGRFGVAADRCDARTFAANFLGQDPEELKDEQVGDILGEVANMVCGSVLGFSKSTQIFELTSPRRVEQSWEQIRNSDSTLIALSFEGAVLIAWLGPTTLEVHPHSSVHPDNA